MSSTILDTCRQPDLVNELEVAVFLCRYPEILERQFDVFGEQRATRRRNGFSERIPVDG
jgi:hypothetical protein